MVRSLGYVQGPRPLWPLAQHLSQDTGRRVRLPIPSTTRAGRAAWHQEGPGCWKSLGGIETRVGNTQKQHTSTGTLDAGTRQIGVPGGTWRREELDHVRP